MSTHRRGECTDCAQHGWLELVHLRWLCVSCRTQNAGSARR